MKNMKSEKNMKRRRFLKVGGAAGAALMMPRLFNARPLNAQGSNDLNIAIIGTGAQGDVLLNACLKIEGLRFKAVCDIWTEFNLKRASRLLQKYGHTLNSYVDYQEMLAKETGLDAVIVATPDFWHAEHAIACMKAGIHVYCEKEMSNSLEQARRMVETARETGKLLQIGHQRRSNPRYLHCSEKLVKEAQIVGQITTINGQWNRSFQPDLGWPEKYAIPPDVLKKYGFESMHQFRNWRWFKGLGGGPIVDLGSHQIDIFSWFLGVNPISVVASGGTDYYDKATHQWYDTVMAIYKFQTPKGIVRAYYQTLTTNSNQGYYESFMGDQATLVISESGGRGGVYREQSAPDWTNWVNLGYVSPPKEEPKKADETVLLDVRETVAPPQYGIPVEFNDPYHKPHLENFFNAVRGKNKLNCPGEIGYETAVAVLKVNEAVEAGKEIFFNQNEFTI